MAIIELTCKRCKGRRNTDYYRDPVCIFCGSDDGLEQTFFFESKDPDPETKKRRVKESKADEVPVQAGLVV